MSIRDCYYYLFYKLYKHYETGPLRWWSDWKAAVSIDALTYFLILAVSGYYSIFTKRIVFKGDPVLPALLIVGAVVFFNYQVFHRNDQWKKYVARFEKLPKRQNRIGGVLVCLLILLIFANLIFMFYLLGKVDWARYR